MAKIQLFDYLELESVGSILSGGHEPGHDDISYLLEVATKMPTSQEDIEDFAAPYVASISITALFNCNELKTKATVYAGNTKVDLDAKYGSLIASSEKAATVTKEISKSNPEYTKLAKEFEKAKAYVEFYNGLSANFEKCHYWAKSREIANNQEFKPSSYEPHHAADGVKGEESHQPEQVHSESAKGQKQKVTPVEDVNLF